jgi:hypothetical protein
VTVDHVILRPFPQVCLIGPGNIVGDMTVLANVRKRTATILCLTDLVCYKIRRATFIRRVPSIQLEVRGGAGRGGAGRGGGGTGRWGIAYTTSPRYGAVGKVGVHHVCTQPRGGRTRGSGVTDR